MGALSLPSSSTFSSSSSSSSSLSTVLPLSLPLSTSLPQPLSVQETERSSYGMLHSAPLSALLQVTSFLFHSSSYPVLSFLVHSFLLSYSIHSITFLSCPFIQIFFGFSSLPSTLLKQQQYSIKILSFGENLFSILYISYYMYNC